MIDDDVEATIKLFLYFAAFLLLAFTIIGILKVYDKWILI